MLEVLILTDDLNRVLRPRLMCMSYVFNYSSGETELLTSFTLALSAFLRYMSSKIFISLLFQSQYVYSINIMNTAFTLDGILFATKEKGHFVPGIP